MTQKNYAMWTGLVFSAVTVFHALRLLYGWQVNVAGWETPMWLSGAGIIVAGFLAYNGMKLSK